MHLHVLKVLRFFFPVDSVCCLLFDDDATLLYVANMQYALVLPGVELPEAAVQVFERSNQEPPAVNANMSVVVAVRVQDEHRVELLTLPESSHQSRVVMQPESLAEPVDTRMGHGCEHKLVL